MDCFRPALPNGTVPARVRDLDGMIGFQYVVQQRSIARRQIQNRNLKNLAGYPTGSRFVLHRK